MHSTVWAIFLNKLPGDFCVASLPASIGTHCSRLPCTECSEPWPTGCLYFPFSLPNKALISFSYQPFTCQACASGKLDPTWEVDLIGQRHSPSFGPGMGSGMDMRLDSGQWNMRVSRLEQSRKSFQFPKRKPQMGKKNLSSSERFVVYACSLFPTSHRILKRCEPKGQDLIQWIMLMALSRTFFFFFFF